MKKYDNFIIYTEEGEIDIREVNKPLVIFGYKPTELLAIIIVVVVLQVFMVLITQSLISLLFGFAVVGILYGLGEKRKKAVTDGKTGDKETVLEDKDQFISHLY